LFGSLRWERRKQQQVNVLQPQKSETSHLHPKPYILGYDVKFKSLV